jgi:molybdopterin-guanine dinucleotide biosynthesis protein A
MGQDKARLLVDGQPLAARPAGVLRGLAAELILVGGAVPGVEGRVVADRVAGAGPLGGLVSGLRAAHTPLAVAAACDMPSLVPELVADLLRRLAAEPARLAAHCWGEHGAEPFPLALRCDVAATLEALVDAGTRRMSDALATLDPIVVGPADWSELDPAGASFVNWNWPEDVGQAAAEAGQPGR